MMNERYKELAEQANLKLDELSDDTFIPLEKFAELIVEECATVIERNLFQGIGWNTSRAVKRHFGIGVEE
jgi:hypothetical protein